MSKKPAEYVHVVESKTRKVIHTVKCDGQRAERVAAGMYHNLDHARFELSISESPTEP